MVAEHFSQRLVEKMGRGVVRHCRKTDGPRHNSSNTFAFGKPITLEQEHLT